MLYYNFLCHTVITCPALRHYTVSTRISMILRVYNRQSRGCSLNLFCDRKKSSWTLWFLLTKSSSHVNVSVNLSLQPSTFPSSYSGFCVDPFCSKLRNISNKTECEYLKKHQRCVYVCLNRISNNHLLSS